MAERTKMSLTMKVVLGLILGLITGVIINTFFSENQVIDTWLTKGIFHMLGAMFINSLKMLVVRKN